MVKIIGKLNCTSCGWEEKKWWSWNGVKWKDKTEVTKVTPQTTNLLPLEPLNKVVTIVTPVSKNICFMCKNSIIHDEIGKKEESDGNKETS